VERIHGNETFRDARSAKSAMSGMTHPKALGVQRRHARVGVQACERANASLHTDAVVSSADLPRGCRLAVIRSENIKSARHSNDWNE
jgi:hypothetical protein